MSLMHNFSIRFSDGLELQQRPEASNNIFWDLTPHPGGLTYADGPEQLIRDYNRQLPSELLAWTAKHELTPEQRFILIYNTSPDRANVLRNLIIAPTDRVLEIGCGCGAVSQWLWSQCATLSVEGSESRALAAAERLSRISNPHNSALLRADIHQLQGNDSFDWVILVGVLEYAEYYSGGQSKEPYHDLLRKASSFLRPGGQIIVAIENRLGLKYFAGAPEDHYGTCGIGLEGYPSRNGRPPIKTFSRAALSALLESSGYTKPIFQFPFPDYKFTKVIIPDDNDAWRFAATHLIDAAPSWRKERKQYFNETAAYQALAADGDAAMFANSFLAIAQKPPATTSKSVTRDHLRYLQCGRRQEDSILLEFDLVKRLVKRQRSSNAAPPFTTLFPPSSLNPLARIQPAKVQRSGQSTSQPIVGKRSLWKTLEVLIISDAQTGGINLIPDKEEIEECFIRYIESLPFVEEGNWDDFISGICALFSRSRLPHFDYKAIEQFLKRSTALAASSLRASPLKSWCIWAPDWIMENLTVEEATGTCTLFDLEYLDAENALPMPILIFRQLRTLKLRLERIQTDRVKGYHQQRLFIDKSEAILPMPFSKWLIERVWPNKSEPEISYYCWFWSKVAEIVECALTASTSDLTLVAYEIRPWLKRLGAELAKYTPEIFHTSTIQIYSEVILLPQTSSGSEGLAAERPRLDAYYSDQLKAKDAALLEKEAEIERLSHAARLSEQALLDASAEADNLRESARLLTAQLHSADQARTSAIAAAEERGHQLATIKASLESQIASLRDALLNHSDQLEAKDTAILDKEAEIERLSHAARLSEQALLDASAEADNLRESARLLTAQLHSADQARTSAIAAAEERGLQLAAIKTSLESQIAALRDSLLNNSNQLKAKDAANLEKETEIENLRLAARLSEQVLLDASAEADNLRESARLLTTQLHSADRARLSAIAAAEERGLQLSAIKTSLEAEIERLRHALTRMQAEFIASNREANLMREIAEARGREMLVIKESLEKECARKDDEIRLLTTACIEREQLLQQGTKNTEPSP